MKFASFKYHYSCNLGDEIQSLAAEQFLPRIDMQLDRDNLGYDINNERCLIIMNGWFSHFPTRCFPPEDSITPVFIGFHMTDFNDTIKCFLSAEGIDYFKRHEPIGCRDKATMELLAAHGIKSFFSKCLTLTFPTRQVAPKRGKVLLVDADHIPIPEFLHSNAITISHSVPDIYGNEMKRIMANRLLEIYKNEASLVITTRLHCALPCIAMGVPVIFFGDPNNYRTMLLNDLNIDINPLPNKWFCFLYGGLRNQLLGKLLRKLTVPIFHRKVNWHPQSVCIEKEKSTLRTMITDLLHNKMINL